jgi:hypothetical protein
MVRGPISCLEYIPRDSLIGDVIGGTREDNREMITVIEV